MLRRRQPKKKPRGGSAPRVSIHSSAAPLNCFRRTCPQGNLFNALLQKDGTAASIAAPEDEASRAEAARIRKAAALEKSRATALAARVAREAHETTVLGQLLEERGHDDDDTGNDVPPRGSQRAPAARAAPAPLVVHASARLGTSSVPSPGSVGDDSDDPLRVSSLVRASRSAEARRCVLPSFSSAVASVFAGLGKSGGIAPSPTRVCGEALAACTSTTRTCGSCCSRVGSVLREPQCFHCPGHRSA